MKKTLKIPEVLYRMGTFSRDDGDSDEMELSISSATPYKRYNWSDDSEYFEVLKHTPESMDSSRLKEGAALLFNHNRDIHLGTIKAPEFRDGKCYVKAKLSKADDVKSYRTRINEGILKDTSVGYRILDEGTCTGTKDGLPVYEFKWLPHEASLVTIPADITVGVGRQRAHEMEEKGEVALCEISVEIKEGVDTNTNQTHTTTQPKANSQTKDMKLTPGARKFFQADTGGGSDGNEGTITVAEAAQREEQAGQRSLEAYGAKVGKIKEWIKALPKEGWRKAASEVAESYLAITDKRAFDEFRTEALAKCEAAALTVPDDNAELGLSKNDRRGFSLRKAILETAMQHRGQGKGLTGHELAVCKASQELYGKEREFVGLCIPDDMLRANFAEDHDLGSNGMRALAESVNDMRRALNASTFTAGGALVGTELLGGSMIDILRNAVLIGQGPLAITELGGLTSNIAIPKQTGTGTVYWLSEGAAITLSQQVFAQLNLSPKRMGVATAYTKQLLTQASLSVEAFVRSDQALAMAVEEDRVTINGTGVGGEPIGILNTTGVLSNVTFSGAAVWGDMVALEYGLENANVRNGMMAILTSPLTKSYLKQTVQVASSTFPIFLWMAAKGEFPTIVGVMPGIINEYPAYATKNVTTNVMIQGVFKNVIKARWAGFDVVVDPYTGALSETINIIVNQWLDIGLRYPQSFNATVDAPTAP